jgi:hypothetical protein
VTPPSSPVASTPASQPVAPAAAPQKLSAGIKIAIAVVAVLFLGGMVVIGGLFYAAHRVSQKYHEITSGIAPPSSTTRNAPSASASDTCRYLTKTDVSAAIGVEIVRSETIDNGCNFYAKGDQADMTSRHMAAMMAARGADPQAQKMMQGLSSGLFKNLQQQDHRSGDNSGTVVVFNYSIDDNDAVAQMQLNRKAMGSLGPGGASDLPGLADEAFVTGESTIIARKGDKLIRVMYMTCPCGTDAVKPLVRKLAAAL